MEPSQSFLKYGIEDLERELRTVKPCAPLCTVSCVHQVSMIDQFRESPRESLGRFFPAQPDGSVPYDPPGVIRVLVLMFLPPEGNGTRKKLTQYFTQVALWCLKAK